MKYNLKKLRNFDKIQKKTIIIIENFCQENSLVLINNNNDHFRANQAILKAAVQKKRMRFMNPNSRIQIRIILRDIKMILSGKIFYNNNSITLTLLGTHNLNEIYKKENFKWDKKKN